MSSEQRASGELRAVTARHETALLFRWQRAIRDSVRLTPNARLVALTLATFMRSDGTGAFPTAATLARSTGLSDRTVRTRLDELRATGFLTFTLKGRPGARGFIRAYAAAIPADSPGESPAMVAGLGASSPATDDVQVRQPTTVKSGNGCRQTTHEHPNNERARRTRRVSLPVGFAPDAELRAWAREHVPAADVEHETAKFREHHAAHDSRLADWRAAWRSWMLRARQFQSGGAITGPDTERAGLLGMAELLGIERGTDESEGAYLQRIRSANRRRMERLQ